MTDQLFLLCSTVLIEFIIIITFISILVRDPFWRRELAFELLCFDFMHLELTRSSLLAFALKNTSTTSLESSTLFYVV